jgi:hypothetical protein
MLAATSRGLTGKQHAQATCPIRHHRLRFRRPPAGRRMSRTPAGQSVRFAIGITGHRASNPALAANATQVAATLAGSSRRSNRPLPPNGSPRRCWNRSRRACTPSSPPAPTSWRPRRRTRWAGSWSRRCRSDRRSTSRSTRSRAPTPMPWPCSPEATPLMPTCRRVRRTSAAGARGPGCSNWPTATPRSPRCSRPRWRRRTMPRKRGISTRRWRRRRHCPGGSSSSSRTCWSACGTTAAAIPLAAPATPSCVRSNWARRCC